MFRTPILALVLGGALACGADEPRLDGGMDGSVQDSGARDAGRLDAGTLDSGTADAGPDGGPRPECTTDADCAPFFYCMDGECHVPDDFPCCAGQECPGATLCDRDRCRCRDFMGGCCVDWTRCEVETERCEDDCTCGPRPPCSPPCAAGSFCERGRCIHRCAFEGCSGGELCTEDGCIPRMCTEAECLLHIPPEHCDPTIGCFDSCAEDPFLVSVCTGMDAECLLGTCVDPLCRPATLACDYRTDCCGNEHCLAAEDPDPDCPTPCPMPFPAVIRHDLCLCVPGGGCADLGRDVPE